MVKNKDILSQLFKTISFQDHYIFATNLTFLDAIGRFPAKSSVTHQISKFTTKINSRSPKGPLRPRMSKFGSIILKHKNRNISKSNNSSNLKFSHKVTCLYAHNLLKIQPSILSGSKVITKRFSHNSFQDHWTNPFQDHQTLQNITLFIYTWNILSRPLPRSVEISFQDHCTLHYILQGSNPLKMQFQIISRPSY